MIYSALLIGHLLEGMHYDIGTVSVLALYSLYVFIHVYAHFILSFLTNVCKFACFELALMLMSVMFLSLKVQKSVCLTFS